MDIQLFAVKLNRPLTEKEAETMLRVLPPERRERLLRMPRAELRQEPLCAYAVLYMATRTLCGWKELPEMRYNRYGKPEFADYPELQFNISHTRHAALVGLHNKPIGVDIEKIRPVSERTMQRIAGTASQKEFFESWVRREARSKWTGAGISSIREENNGVQPYERIVYLDTFPDYVACVCTHSDARIPHVKTLEIN